MKYIFALFILICITLFNLSPFGFKILAGFDHAQGGTLVFVPNANELVAGNGAFTSPTATTPRTYQWLIHESQLTALVGKNLTAITYRLPTSATGPWPTTDVTYSDYDIYLSGSVSPENRSLAFAQKCCRDSNPSTERSTFLYLQIHLHPAETQMHSDWTLPLINHGFIPADIC